MDGTIVLTRNAKNALKSVRPIYGNANSAIIGLVEDRKQFIDEIRKLEDEDFKTTEMNNILSESLTIQVEATGKERKSKINYRDCCILLFIINIVTNSYFVIERVFL